MKWWIGVVTAVTIVCAWLFGWAELPKKVSTIEQKAQTLEQSVTNVNVALEKYIAVQQVKEEADEKKEELLLKLLEQMAK